MAIHTYTESRRQSLNLQEQEFADITGWPVHRGEIQRNGLLYQTALYSDYEQCERGLEHLSDRLYNKQVRLKSEIEVYLWHTNNMVTLQTPDVDRPGTYSCQILTVHPDGKLELTEPMMQDIR